MTTDCELLGCYARTRSEEAFAELVRRHVNLVYSAALRHVNDDAHLAQDVAQTVFADLARKAGSLARREGLTGWLYTSAHFAAAKAARTENRRRNREEQFMREPTLESAPVADWEKLRPVLDAAMHELKEADREAILLRYFENRQFAEVGEKFGLNENAARMRVERALEKLRAVFLRRGIAATATLASVISANAIQIAPAGLAATLASASLAGAGAGTTFTLLKLMTATKLKLGLSVLAIAGATTALVVQHQTQTRLRAENESLTQQLAQLKTENESLSKRLAVAADNESLTDEQKNELLKLRGEAGQLKKQLTEATLIRAANLLSQESKIDSTEAIRAAKTKLAREWLLALLKYSAENQGQLPANLDQAMPFLSNEARTQTNLMTNPFEIVYPESRLVLTNAESGVMVREQQPWQGVGTNWGRLYGWIQADGGRESFAFMFEGDRKSLEHWEAQTQWEMDYDRVQQQDTQ